MITVRRALILSTSERYCGLIVNFVTLTIVSRLLSPSEIGVSVVGTAIIALAISAREFASPNYIFQEKNLTTEMIRSVFTVMLLTTGAISVVLAVSAYWLADAYGEPRLGPYLQLIAACIFLELFSLPVITLWRREMAFVKVLIVNVSGTLTTAICTISLALNGFSYMSFAWAWLAGAVVTATMANLMARRFREMKPKFSGLREMLTFGGYHGATVALYRLYEQMPYLMLGRYVSVDAAAIFNRSFTICQLPDKVLMSGVISVALPAFSADVRSGNSLKNSYLHATSLITALQWPAYMTLAVLAYPVVHIIFGPQWNAVAPLVQIIALSSLFSFSFELNYPVLIAVGAVRAIFLRALIVFPLAAAIVTLASLLGLKAVAWAMLLVVPLHAYVSLRFVCHYISIGWREIGGAIWGSCLVTLSTVSGPLCIVYLLGTGFEISIGWAITCLIVAGFGWFASLWILNHPLLAEIIKMVPSGSQFRVSKAET